MHKEAMFIAGRICSQTWLSDAELDVAIKATERVLSYCKGRGESFSLITSKLTQELETYERYKQARKSRV